MTLIWKISLSRDHIDLKVDYNDRDGIMLKGTLFSEGQGRGEI